MYGLSRGDEMATNRATGRAERRPPFRPPSPDMAAMTYLDGFNQSDFFQGLRISTSRTVAVHSIFEMCKEVYMNMQIWKLLNGCYAFYSVIQRNKSSLPTPAETTSSLSSLALSQYLSFHCPAVSLLSPWPLCVYQFHPLCCQPRMHYLHHLHAPAPSAPNTIHTIYTHLHHLHQTRSTPSTCTKHRLQGTII